jgi:hypothetical protein
MAIFKVPMYTKRKIITKKSADLPNVNKISKCKTPASEQCTIVNSSPKDARFPGPICRSHEKPREECKVVSSFIKSNIISFLV